MGNTWRVEYDLCNLAGNLVGARERRAWRQLDDIEEVALILLRDKPGRRLRELIGRDTDKARIEHHHDEGNADKPSRERAITGGDPFKDMVEAIEETSDRTV